MNNFKKDDLVKVLDPDILDKYPTEWQDQMDKSIGKIYRIDTMTPSGRCYSLKNHDGYVYPKQCLELVTPEFNIEDTVKVFNPNLSSVNVSELPFRWVSNMWDSIGKCFTVKGFITGEEILSYELSNGYIYSANVLGLISKNSEGQPVETEETIVIAFPCK